MGGLWVELVKLLPPLAEGDADQETTDEEMLETVRTTLEKGPLKKSAEGEDAEYLAALKAGKQERLNKALEARVHPLEGHKMLKKGLQKSQVRTMSGRKIVVEAEELVACAHAVSKSKKAEAKKAAAATTGGSAPTTPRSEKKSLSTPCAIALQRVPRPRALHVLHSPRFMAFHFWLASVIVHSRKKVVYGYTKP